MQQQQLFEKLFHTSPRKSGNTALLQKEAKEFPFFSLPHYFLLKETGIGNSDYKSIAGKASIHFNNAYLLNIRLHDLGTNLTPEYKIASNNSPIEKKVEQNAVVETNQDDLLFEPLHTTDYFASQGIKMSAEIKPDDKLGKQMKSFTEWLKAMKKNKMARPTEDSEVIDLSVERMAEKSNMETEVLTESMAEVFIEQGKWRKALEIYEKLSLLNPDKSVYFAGKIESLKEK